MSDVNNKLEEKGFQSFEPLKESSSIFVSEKLREEMDQKILVHRYLPIDRLVDSAINSYLYLASPSEWDDPFETKYLEILDEPNSILLEGLQPEDKARIKAMSIFCTCMTYNDSDSEEASWKSYSDNKEQIVRVSYNFDELCRILSEKTEERLYVGMLDYKTRQEIVHPTLADVKENAEFENNLEKLYVNNFCLKQEAYKYEKELRFCKIMNDEQYIGKKGIKIENIDLGPAINHITLPPINYKGMVYDELTRKKMEQIKKSMILKSIYPGIRVFVSNLYDSTKEDMISELTY